MEETTFGTGAYSDYGYCGYVSTGVCEGKIMLFASDREYTEWLEEHQED